MKKVLVCGSRDWLDREPIRVWLCKLHDWGFDTLIEGEARGADTIAREEAEKLGFTVLKFPADWDKYHKAAGPIRNKQMLVEGKPDLVIAFSKDIQNSKGTKNMIQQADSNKPPIHTIVVSK
jgi:hypothetical protein